MSGDLFDLDGQLAVITGGGTGLGRRFAATLAGRGARVVQEMESRMEGSCCSKALTRLDFPAPLGATTMKTFPGLACMNCDRGVMLRVRG